MPPPTATTTTATAAASTTTAAKNGKGYYYGSISIDDGDDNNRNDDGNDGPNKNGESTPLIDRVKIEQNDGNDNSDDDPKSPSSSIWSRLTFQWFVPVLQRGNEKQKLDAKDLDLVPLPADCTTERLIDDFERCWREELRSSGNNPSLLRALYRAFGRDYVSAGLLKLVNDLCTFVGPQFLNAMILFLRSEEAPMRHGIALTAAVTASQITMSLCLRHYFFKVRERRNEMKE